MVKYKRIEHPKSKTLFLIIVTTIWLIYGLIYILNEITHNYKVYLLLMKLPLDKKREVTTGSEFYQFLKFCDSIIPEGKDIKWILPAGNFLGYDEYLFYKAYYYLYPRNYRDNADYIIVFGREGYHIPEGFKLIAQIDKNKYILAK